ncbi:MAG: serine/threonine-protein kinase, partial [Verrucomicrobiota bacterium]
MVEKERTAPIEVMIESVKGMECESCGALNIVEDLPVFSRAKCHQCLTEFTVFGLIDDFKVYREIGSGGMGCVYEAIDPVLHRKVAIKVMNIAFSSNEDFSTKFVNEARTIASFSHPNIVQIHTLGNRKGEDYIVMEYIDGPSLDQLIEQQGQLDELDFLNLALDVTRGLKAAHDAGLIHGDIKPENIMIDPEFRAKLVDFGLTYNADEAFSGQRVG